MNQASSLKRNALLVSVLSSFLAPFVGSSITVALPSIGSDLAMDAISLGWVATAYLLSAAVFLVPVGRASDIYGRKRGKIWRGSSGKTRLKKKKIKTDEKNEKS